MSRRYAMTVRRSSNNHAVPGGRVARDLIERLSSLNREERVAALHGSLPALDLGERFEVLNALGLYHHPESVSGEGSTLAETTVLRSRLPEIVEQYGVRSLLDIPCGDFNWLRHVPLDGVDYVGADIVHGIVLRNRRLYSRDGHRFETLDATRDGLPKVDLVLCRDLLIHLSLRDIMLVLRNVAASGSSWLLATHFVETETNIDILSGGFRPVNLCHEPFRLPEPLQIIIENSRMAGGAFGDRAMALWPVFALEGQ